MNSRVCDVRCLRLCDHWTCDCERIVWPELSVLLSVNCKVHRATKEGTSTVRRFTCISRHIIAMLSCDTDTDIIMGLRITTAVSFYICRFRSQFNRFYTKKRRHAHPQTPTPAFHLALKNGVKNISILILN